MIFLENSKNYAKTSQALFCYARDEPNDSLTVSEPQKVKVRFNGITAAGSLREVHLALALKSLGGF